MEFCTVQVQSISREVLIMESMSQQKVLIVEGRAQKHHRIAEMSQHSSAL
jgi:hypothetical protein